MALPVHKYNILAKKRHLLLYLYPKGNASFSARIGFWYFFFYFFNV